MATIEARAPAKINLTLHITGQRDDGYHLLDSLVVFADVADVLTLTPAPRIRMTVSGPFAAGVPADATNLVWRAVEMCGGSFEIGLIKNIPHGAGLGGGSSDAAAILRQLDNPGKASLLGADVPVCLSSGPQRMRGIGEVLDPVPSVPTFAMVLVNPGVHVATPAVFRALANRNNAPMPGTPDGDWLSWLAEQRNDMQQAAQELAPEIGAALSALGEAEIARMSGSGSTCFGIYSDWTSAEAAARNILSNHPDWWVVPTRTVASPVS